MNRRSISSMDYGFFSRCHMKVDHLYVRRMCKLLGWQILDRKEGNEVGIYGRFSCQKCNYRHGRPNLSWWRGPRIFYRMTYQYLFFLQIEYLVERACKSDFHICVSYDSHFFSASLPSINPIQRLEEMCYCCAVVSKFSSKRRNASYFQTDQQQLFSFLPRCIHIWPNMQSNTSNCC